jgi:hypothetical protein
MKLVHRLNGEFDLKENTHFNLFPQSPTDLVRLSVTEENISFIIKSLDWS